MDAPENSARRVHQLTKLMISVAIRRRLTARRPAPISGSGAMAYRLRAVPARAAEGKVKAHQDIWKDRAKNRRAIVARSRAINSPAKKSPSERGVKAPDNTAVDEAANAGGAINTKRVGKNCCGNCP